MTKVEKQEVPFLLSSLKQKCSCKYGEDVRNDKSVQYIQIYYSPTRCPAYLVTSGLGKWKKPSFLSQGLEEGV